LLKVNKVLDRVNKALENKQNNRGLKLKKEVLEYLKVKIQNKLDDLK
jgi:hypothetical protein